MDIHIIESAFEFPYKILATLHYEDVNNEGDWPDIEIVNTSYFEDFKRDYKKLVKEYKGRYPYMSFRQGKEVFWGPSDG